MRLTRQWRTRAGHVAVAAAVALAVGAGMPAGAQPTAIVASYDHPTYGYTYLPGGDHLPAGTLVVVAGTEVLFVNLEYREHHSMTSYATAPGGGPLFDSGLKDFLDSGSVDGIPDLPPGTYAFYCTKHAYQRGVLEVIE